MSIISSIILGLVQGLTEFLPVSSSGHLVIFNELLNTGIDDGTAFFVLLHLATFISVCIAYRKDVIELIKEFFLLISDLFHGKFNMDRPYRRMLIMIIIATIPAVIVGLLFSIFDLDSKLDTLPVVGSMLLITAVLMFIVDRLGSGTKKEKNTTFKDAVLVGLAQACALMPGLSRSGSTITAARSRGFKKEYAIKFSFLMSLPTILGAAVLEGIGLIKDGGASFELVPAIAGFIAAAISGILAIKFLQKLIKSGKFYIFSIYCLLMGAACIFFM